MLPDGCTECSVCGKPTRGYGGGLCDDCYRHGGAEGEPSASIRSAIEMAQRFRHNGKLLTAWELSEMPRNQVRHFGENLLVAADELDHIVNVLIRFMKP